MNVTPKLKCEQKLPILSFKEDIAEVPAGCPLEMGQ